MGRANNVSRSLIIISKAQGWDPCHIDGKPFMNNEYAENRVIEGDARWGALPTSPQSATPNASMQGPDTRCPGAIGSNHGKHNPNAGK